MRVVLFLSCIVLFFSGCSPKYVITNHYIPSNDSEFVPCVKVCDEIRKSCDYDFQVSQKTCADAAYDRAKITHDTDMIAYEKNYRRYLRDFTIYQSDERIWHDTREILQKDFHYFDANCKKNAHKYACQRSKEIVRDLHFHNANKPKKPFSPHKPLFSKYLDAELLVCKVANHCESNYDKCYVSCGGEIIPQKICVSNCD